MRIGPDDAPDGVKSVLSGLPWSLAAVMPVTLRSCSVPSQEGWPKPSAQFDPAWPTVLFNELRFRGARQLMAWARNGHATFQFRVAIERDLSLQLLPNSAHRAARHAAHANDFRMGHAGENEETNLLAFRLSDALTMRLALGPGQVGRVDVRLVDVRSGEMLAYLRHHTLDGLYGVAQETRLVGRIDRRSSG